MAYAQISTANLESIMDKLARFAAEANGDPLASAIATGGAYAVTVPNSGVSVGANDVVPTLQTLISGFTDMQQQDDLGPSVVGLGTTFNIQSYVYSLWVDLVKGLNKQGQRFNTMLSTDRSGLDAMLRVLNATTLTLRAHGSFSKYFGGLSPVNVFTPIPAVIATLSVSATNVVAVGTVTPLDLTQYGTGQLAIQNTKAEGLTSTVFTVTSPTQTNTFTVSSQTNNELTAGSDNGKTWSTISTVTVSGGFNTDTFNLVILPDRTVNTA